MWSSEWTMTTDWQNLYIWWYNANLIKVDISSWAVTATLPISRPIGHSFDYERWVLYVIAKGADQLVEVDVATFTLTGRVLNLPASYSGNRYYDVEHRQNYIFATCHNKAAAPYDGLCVRINKSDFTVDIITETAGGPGMAVLEWEYLIFPCYQWNVITIIDTRTNLIHATISQNQPRWLSAHGDRMHVTWYASTNITEYNVKTLAATWRVRTIWHYGETSVVF